MKKNLLFIIIILVILLTACSPKQPSAEVIQTALAQTVVALTPTATCGECQISNGMIQTAIAQTMTAGFTPEAEISQALTPTPTNSISVFENTPVIATQLDGYIGDFLSNGAFAIRVSSIEYPSNYDLYDLKDGEAVVGIDAEFVNLSNETIRLRFRDLLWLVDNDGYKYKIRKSVTDDYGIDHLPPQEKVRSLFYTALLEGTTPQVLKYVPDNSAPLQVNLGEVPVDHTPMQIELQQPVNTSIMGSVAESNGYKAFALQVVDPYLNWDGYTGYKVISVEVSFENVNSDTPLDLDNLCDIYLIDTEGYAYPQDWQIRIYEDGLEEVTLAKGEKVKGWLFFQIYEDANPSYLRYEDYLYVGLN